MQTSDFLQVDEGNTVAVILAAGSGKRMNSSLPKVAHILGDKCLIIWVIESLISAGVQNLVIVISPLQTLVKEIVLKNSFSRKIKIEFAYQDTPQGTAHAVNCGIKSVPNLFQNNIPKDLKILVAYGDTPAVMSETFKQLASFHKVNHNSFTIIAFNTSTPYGYGRIIVNQEHEFIAIREQKDCSEEETKISMCNSGFLCANYLELSSILPLIKNDNIAKEYYLTDIPLYAKERGFKIGLMIKEDESQFLGINTQEQLKDMEKLFLKK